MTSEHAPQMSAISGNKCPNSRPRSLSEFSSCTPDALTTWGYCVSCWQTGSVPAAWAAKVDAYIEKAIRP